MADAETVEEYRTSPVTKVKERSSVTFSIDEEDEDEDN